MTAAALVVFAKVPRAGFVKTRLCPPLSLDQATALYECMLDDVLEESAAACSLCSAALHVTVHPAEEAGAMAQRVPASARVVAQRGRNLAARMQHAIAQCAAAGFDRIVLRGSDSPALSRERIAQAFRALDEADVALAPGCDGGYDLLAVRRPHLGLLDHEMSTESVAADTLANARKLGLRCFELEPGFDIDAADDLLRLRDERPRLAVGLCRRTLERLDREGWWPPDPADHR